MASSVDTNLNDFKINSVASEEVLRQMEQDGLLEPNQIYMTPDENNEDYYKAGNGISIENGVISASQTYSTEEQLTGDYWIDGKPIYRRVINFGTLPNTTTKAVNISSYNIEKLISYRGMAYRSDAQIELPHYDKTYYIAVSYDVNNSNINVYASNDRSSFKESYLIIEYTKK